MKTLIGLLAGLTSTAIPLVAGAASLIASIGASVAVAVGGGAAVVLALFLAQLFGHRGDTSMRIQFRLNELETERAVLEAEQEVLRVPHEWPTHHGS